MLEQNEECFACKKQDVALFGNEDMDTNNYCEPCLAVYNQQRFYRHDFIPDARVQIEYDFIPEYNPKTKRYDNKGKPFYLPKTQQFATRGVVDDENKQSLDKNTTDVCEQGPTILELARMPHEEIKAVALQKKHPHAKDNLVRLDETNKRHDYYVMIDGKEETQFFQSTSGVIHDVFPKQMPEPMELLFGENNYATHDLCKTYFNEQKVAELTKFASDVLVPLKKYSNDSYNQGAFTDKVLGGKDWGANHPKHGKYFTTDKHQLVCNLKQMHVDWAQKADDGCTRGTFVHYLIELDLNGDIDLATHPIYSKPNLKHIQQYLKWKKTYFDPFFEPYRTEMRLCDINDKMQSEYRRVGTCDLIAVPKNHPPPSETGGVLRVKLIDWKNTIIQEKSFFDRKRGYQMGVEPMDAVHDCNLRHYEFQQADYQRMLVKFCKDFTYNGYMYDRVEFLARELVCFDDTNANNEAIVKTLGNTYERELDIIWARRKRDVEEWSKQRHMPKPPKKHFKLTDDQYSYLLLHLIHKNELFKQIEVDKKKNQHLIGGRSGPDSFQQHKRRCV